MLTAALIFYFLVALGVALAFREFWGPDTNIVTLLGKEVFGIIFWPVKIGQLLTHALRYYKQRY